VDFFLRNGSALVEPFFLSAVDESNTISNGLFFQHEFEELGSDGAASRPPDEACSSWMVTEYFGASAGASPVNQAMYLFIPIFPV
jgi:hypothetical protein